MLEIPPTKNPRKKIMIKRSQLGMIIIKRMWPPAAISNPKKDTTIHLPQRKSDSIPNKKLPVIVPISYIIEIKALSSGLKFS